MTACGFVLCVTVVKIDSTSCEAYSTCVHVRPTIHVFM